MVESRSVVAAISPPVLRTAALPTTTFGKPAPRPCPPNYDHLRQAGAPPVPPELVVKRGTARRRLESGSEIAEVDPTSVRGGSQARRQIQGLIDQSAPQQRLDPYHAEIAPLVASPWLKRGGRCRLTQRAARQGNLGVGRSKQVPVVRRVVAQFAPRGHSARQHRVSVDEVPGDELLRRMQFGHRAQTRRQFSACRPRRSRDGDWRTSGGRRDSGIRRQFISSISARLKGEPDQGYLQGQSDPGEHLGRLVVAVLGGYGGLQVGRPDDHQEHRGGDPSPPVPAPKPDGADELDHPTGVDQFGRPRQNTRDKGREDSRAGQVHKPANRKEGCDNPRAIASAPAMSTTGCLHRLTLGPVTRGSGPPRPPRI